MSEYIDGYLDGLRAMSAIAKSTVPLNEEQCESMDTMENFLRRVLTGEGDFLG